MKTAIETKAITTRTKKSFSWTLGHLNSLHIPYCTYIWISQFYDLLICVKATETMANSVNPDQTPRSAPSDLGLHCLLRFVYYWGNTVFPFVLSSSICLHRLPAICDIAWPLSRVSADKTDLSLWPTDYNIYKYMYTAYTGITYRWAWVGRLVRKCRVSYVTGAFNWYWLTVGQGQLSL